MIRVVVNGEQIEIDDGGVTIQLKPTEIHDLINELRKAVRQYYTSCNPAVGLTMFGD
jgi:hypothetical protein